jgi:hypothetical protein
MKKILHGRIHPNSSVCTEGPDPARPSTDGSHQAHKGPSCLGAQHFHRFRNQIFSGETTKEFDERNGGLIYVGGSYKHFQGYLADH